MKKTLIILFVVISISYSQGISELKLIDGYSMPLKYGDDGIKFQYSTTSSGKLSAYLKVSSNNFKIFSNKQEFKGFGLIRIPASRLSNLCNYYNSFDSNTFFRLEHISSRTNKYSFKTIALKIEYEAPYGCKLEDYPKKPKMYSTDYTKMIVQPVPATGFITGSVLTLAGFVVKLVNQKDGEVVNEETEKSADIVIGIGAVLALLSYPFVDKRVPDEERNYSNKRKNNELLYNWERKYNRVDKHNQLIRATFKIRFSVK